MDKRAKIADKIATTILYATALFFVFLLCAITGYILYKGALAFDSNAFSVGPDGIGSQLFNTIYLVSLSLLFTVPSGILAGIYISQYAKPGRFTDILRTCIETLSSLPSIVVGLFGYNLFVLMTHSQWNLMAGALSLAILNIPLMTKVTEEAFSSIPAKYRDGSFAVGATPWQTIIHILFPAALPRIITGIILAAGRGFGEAAVLMYTSGMSSSINWKNWNPFVPYTPFNPFRPADTLAVHIWALKTQSISHDATRLANLSAAVLIILVAVFSLSSRFVSNKLEERNK